ncbi:MAG: MarC family protein [Syntrophobacteraceae bacterium]
MVLRVTFSDALIVFFLTLGPLKAIAPFARLTRGATSAFCRNLAWRATAIATLLVIVVALLGSLVLQNWNVSVAAIIITGGIILFCQAFQMVIQPPGVEPPEPPSDVAQSAPTLRSAQFSFAVPALVSAPSIAAIAGFMAIAGNDWTQKGIVLVSLLVIMGLNLVVFLNFEKLVKQHPNPGLQLLGWVMAILQATLAAQYVINGLVRLGALSG